ncbi:GtrA family protein [Streptomyces albidochromogenes]|uniref:GtrA family protein n=1 Tax=Streptomyces albidochromogenes TaxID=329524 RepID=A0ABW6FFW6_9ACTN
MIRRQLIRFAVVGVVNTGTYYACYLLLLPWLPYVAAHVLAFAVSMVGSFFLTCRFTYNTRPTWRKFLLFPLTNAANLVITTSGVYLLVDVLRLDSRYAPLVAAAAAIPVTFAVSRMIMLGGPAPDAEAAADSASTKTRESLGESVARTTPTA